MKHNSLIYNITVAVCGLIARYFAEHIFPIFVPVIMYLNKLLRFSALTLFVVFDIPHLLIFCAGAYIINSSNKSQPKHFWIYLFFFWLELIYYEYNSNFNYYANRENIIGVLIIFSLMLIMGKAAWFLADIAKEKRS